jgi:hypothetical protein
LVLFIVVLKKDLHVSAGSSFVKGKKQGFFDPLPHPALFSTNQSKFKFIDKTQLLFMNMR